MAGVLYSHTCKNVGVYTGGVGMEAVERLGQQNGAATTLGGSIHCFVTVFFLFTSFLKCALVSKGMDHFIF